MNISRVLTGALLLLLSALSAFLPSAKATGSETEVSYPTDKSSNTGYSSARFTVPFDGAEPEQVYGTEGFREDGYLVLSNTTDYRFAYLERYGKKLITTPYTVSKMDTAWGCYTSLCTSPAPAVYSVNGNALVSQDGDWYLYDLTNKTKELWFDAATAGLPTDVSYKAIATNDQVYVYSMSYDTTTTITTPIIYWIPKQNKAERIYEIPAGFEKAGYGYSKEVLQPTGMNAIGLSESLGMLVTDYIGDNQAVVGQIGNGVYVEKSGVYTKLGSTETEPTSYSGILPFWKTVPLAVGNNVVWIGADGTLNIAYLDVNAAGLTPTGIQDVPRYVPFSEMSDSTVYQENGKSYVDTQLTAYKNAEEYITANNDPTFSKVIWINDGVISATQKENAN